MDNLKQFADQAYMNLETFRKSGEGVRSPVWFVQDGPTIYACTVNNSGKVKRLRSNTQVRIVPSGRIGEPLGEWTPATGRVVVDPATARAVKTLFEEKYGVQMRMFDEFSEEQMVTLAFTLDGQEAG